MQIWAFEPDVVNSINGGHENPLFLPGVTLHPSITATHKLAATAGADLILAAPPAQHMRGVLKGLAPDLPKGAAVVLCAKGVEQNTSALMTDVMAAELPGAVPAVLSGPGFAKDVSRGLPTAITIASEDADLAARVVAAIGLPTFRPYISDDLVGAEIGGAIKNVVAIACGVAEGGGLAMARVRL